MRILMFALMGILMPLQVRADTSVLMGQVFAEPPCPPWMQTDAKLQTPVTLEAKARPLYVVLAALSTKSGIELRAARDIRDYRVTIYMQSQPLWKILARIQQLFGHGKLPNKGYEWIRETDHDKKAYYYFQRNARAVEEEAAQLNFPAEAAKRWLRATRDYLRMPPGERKTLVTDSSVLQNWIKIKYDPSQALGGLAIQAIGALTDEQLETLAQNKQTDVPQFMLSPDAVEALRKQTQGNGTGSNQNSTLPPSGAQLRMEAEGQDQLQGVYSVSLIFSQGSPSHSPYGFVMDTLNAFDTREETEAFKPDTGPGEIVDLLAHEHTPTDSRPLLSLTNALALLAREAKLSIYAEAFIKNKQPLVVTKGKPEYLLSKICSAFGYRWCKVGSDYLIYDRFWAQDRASDIPQSLQDRWLAAQKAHGGILEPADCFDMARHLSDLQFKNVNAILNIPMNQALIPRQSDLSALRLAASLAPNTPMAGGIPKDTQINDASEANLLLLQKVFQSNQVAFPVEVHYEIKTRSVDTTQYTFFISFKDQKGLRAGGYFNLGEKPIKK